MVLPWIFYIEELDDEDDGSAFATMSGYLVDT